MMALSYKMMGAGTNMLALAAMSDVKASLTATGTGASTAYALVNNIHEFVEVSGGTGAILYAMDAGDSQTVYNGGANPLLVYPATGRKINSLPANTAATVPTATACRFECATTARYIGILSR